MRYIWQHIRAVIEQYNGGIPLSHFLKNYFRIHPKLGSRDRRIISEMAYCYYRLSRGLDASIPLEDKVRISLFIAETSVPQITTFLPAEWGPKAGSPEERIMQLQQQGIDFTYQGLTGFDLRLSGSFTYESWQEAMPLSPLLFIRIRKRKEHCLQALTAAGVEYHEIRKNVLALRTTTALEKWLPADCYVVQDASSQRTGDYFKPVHGEHWWDCCSGAGGKSLLLREQSQKIRLTVSDKRATILHNLKERFRLYGYESPETLQLDVSDPEAVNAQLQGRKFSNIICDVPCSGSGTWFRTPEQLFFFETEKVRQFAALQHSITQNAIRYLKPGGRLIYITCSVFHAENEAVVEAILEDGDMVCEKHELINGLADRADCMFISVIKKRATSGGA
ncbi:MAG: hypothetical protein EOP49_03530 [Sphingobacteriales bacterium]|nr:MAG: hypothetical protein EOP49_03530 [Sphingobacteriales bacterium]